MSEVQRQAPCWLTVAEAARYLHRRGDDVRRAIAAGAIEAYRPQGRSSGVIVHTDALDAWVRGTYDPAICAAAARRVIAREGAR